MYAISVQRDFRAYHFLIGGDWGAENERHPHAYKVELTLEGERLNEHGYLVDIVEIDATLDATIDRYQDKTLNDLSAFHGLNPSIEHFARILCDALGETSTAPNLTTMTVKLWENDIAWASYRKELS